MMTDEFAWLIEAPGQNYLCVQTIGTGNHRFAWTKDHAKALRFYSKAQAQAVHDAVRVLAPDLWAFAVNLGEAWPVEHSWHQLPEIIEKPRSWPRIADEADAQNTGSWS